MLKGAKKNQDEIKIEVSKANGKKCDRCWKILENVCQRNSYLFHWFMLWDRALIFVRPKVDFRSNLKPK